MGERRQRPRVVVVSGWVAALAVAAVLAVMAAGIAATQPPKQQECSTLDSTCEGP